MSATRTECAILAATVTAFSARGDLVFHGHRYFLTPGPVTWHQAQTYAVSQGGNLATIGGVAENNALATAFLTDTIQHVWIGFTDEIIEGDYRWVTAEPIVYTNWAPGEPNNNGPVPHTEDHACLESNGWNDWSSPGTLHFGIVEVELFPARCGIADITTSGGVGGPDGHITVDDLVTYLLSFFGNNAQVADITTPGGFGGPDGQVTVDDLVRFLSAFFAGCP